MRGHRPKYGALSDEARRRANARAYAHVYLKRGKIERGPCEGCAGPNALMHHDDYGEPLQIRWLCSNCRPTKEPHDDDEGSSEHSEREYGTGQQSRAKPDADASTAAETTRTETTKEVSMLDAPAR